MPIIRVLDGVMDLCSIRSANKAKSPAVAGVCCSPYGGGCLPTPGESRGFLKHPEQLEGPGIDLRERLGQLEDLLLSTQQGAKKDRALK